jgi:hypothetical protein
VERRGFLKLALLAPFATGAAAPPLPKPDPVEVLLDVAAHNPAWIHPTIIKTFADLAHLPITMNPVVKMQMLFVVQHGGWIVTTTRPVTHAPSRWTGTPWLVIGSPFQGYYLNKELYTNFGTGTNDGVTTNSDDGTPGLAFGKAVTEFGKSLQELGLAIAAAAKGKGKAVGLGIAALGLAITELGFELQYEAIANSPKQGHADDDNDSAGGPPGSAPNGPPGATPSEGQGSNANGNTPSSGADSAGGDTGGEGDPGEQ